MNLYHLDKSALGSGCEPVDRSVASDTWVPWFKSSNTESNEHFLLSSTVLKNKIKNSSRILVIEICKSKDNTHR